MNKSLLTSNSCEWSTPRSLFDSLYNEFGPFTLDPCAAPWNAKCSQYYTKDQDGLKQPWFGRVFCNPPYGRAIGDWVRKGYESSREALVVMLIPARTDTRWWHEYCVKGEIRFLRGRVHFVREDGKSGPSTFPSAVVVFGK